MIIIHIDDSERRVAFGISNYEMEREKKKKEKNFNQTFSEGLALAFFGEIPAEPRDHDDDNEAMLSLGRWSVVEKTTRLIYAWADEFGRRSDEKIKVNDTKTQV